MSIHQTLIGDLYRPLASVHVVLDRVLLLGNEWVEDANEWVYMCWCYVGFEWVDMCYYPCNPQVQNTL